MLYKFFLVLIFSILGVFSSANQAANQVASKVNSPVNGNVIRQEDSLVSQAEIEQSIEQTIALIETHYIQANAPQTINSLLSNLQGGDPFLITPRDQFAQQLQSRVIKATHDGYFSVKASSTLPIESISSLEQTGSSANRPQHYGEIEVEMLNQNVGVLRFTGDFNSPTLTSEINQTLAKLANIDALIIDLTDVGRGNLLFSQTFVSYFLKPNMPLIDVIHQQGDALTHMKTLNLDTQVSFDRKMPIYILQSAVVSGPWELMSYAMQLHRNAQVIGNESMGVSTITRQFAISSKLVIEIPVAKMLAPTNGKNWESHGVLPDFGASEEESLAIAIELFKNR